MAECKLVLSYFISVKISICYSNMLRQNDLFFCFKKLNVKVVYPSIFLQKSKFTLLVYKFEFKQIEICQIFFA